MNWTHQGMAAVFRAAGFTAVKTAGLVKEAVSPWDVLQKVRRPPPSRSVQRHIDAYNPFAENTEIVGTLRNKPFSQAIRKEWPKAPNLARRFEQAEDRLLRDIRSAPDYSDNTVLNVGTPVEIGPDSIDYMDIERGSSFAPDLNMIESRLNVPTFLHEGRHALQHAGEEGAATPVDRSILNPPTLRPFGPRTRDWEGLLAAEADANRYALEGVTDVDEIADMLAAQASYALREDPALVQYRAGRFQPKGLTERTDRWADLGRRLTHSMFDIEDEFDIGGGDVLPLKTWAQQHARSAHAEEYAELNKGYEEMRRMIRGGWTPEVQAFNTRLQDTQKTLAARTGALAQEVLQEVPEDVQTRHQRLYEGWKRTQNEPEYISPLDQRFWRYAAKDPEQGAVIQAQLGRHRGVTDYLRRTFGDEKADAYDQFVSQKLQAAGAPEGMFGELRDVAADKFPPADFLQAVLGLK